MGTWGAVTTAKLGPAAVTPATVRVPSVTCDPIRATSIRQTCKGGDLMHVLQKLSTGDQQRVAQRGSQQLFLPSHLALLNKLVCRFRVPSPAHTFWSAELASCATKPASGQRLKQVTFSTSGAGVLATTATRTGRAGHVSSPSNERAETCWAAGGVAGSESPIYAGASPASARSIMYSATVAMLTDYVLMAAVCVRAQCTCFPIHGQQCVSGSRTVAEHVMTSTRSNPGQMLSSCCRLGACAYLSMPCKAGTMAVLSAGQTAH